MSNLRMLTERLMTVSERLEQNPAYMPQAREMANVARQVISAHRLYLEYKAAKQEAPISASIDSLGGAVV